MSRLTVCATSLVLMSCFKTPIQSQGTVGHRLASTAGHRLAGTIAANGVATAQVDANSTDTQLVSVPTGSTVSGSSLSLPPGALSISTQILIEEATPLTTATSLSELSVNSQVLHQGTAVSIQASESIDAKKPMTIAIPLPTGFGLAGVDFSHVAVLYRVTRNDQSSNVSGIIPNSLITFESGFAKVQSFYFGAYQVVVTSEPLEAKEVKVETPAFTKSTVENKPKISISSASENVIQKDRTITINGMNFRSNMVLALGNTKITNLKIASDAKASFVAGTGDLGGRMALTAEQDGAISSIPVFFLPSAEDLPIITMLPTEVCQGIRYFDRSGSMQVGIKNCTADIAGLAAADLRTGVKVGSIVGTLPAYAVCASDGNVGCIVLGPSFATVAVSGAAAKILVGQTLGGISGSAIASPANCTTDGGTACVATASYPSAQVAGAAAKIASGTTLAGVSGTAGVRPTDCSTDGGTGCVAVTNFPAVDKVVRLSASNLSRIHSALIIAGVAGALPDCATDGGMGCFANPGFPAANAAGGAAKILAGQSLAGIAGTALTRPADCASDGQLTCVTKAGFPAVNLAVLTTGVLKSGMTVAGVTGSYPNAAYPLAAADGYADLDVSTFNIKIKASTPFGWFDRNGTRFTGAGDIDINGPSIKNGLDIFGSTGTFGPPCTADGQANCLVENPFKAANTNNFNSWDIRAGKTIASIMGNISFNKNTANLSVYNRMTGTSASSSGSIADFYDTVDDFNNSLAGLPTLAFGPAPIPSIFRDLASDTGVGGGTASNGVCDGTEDCVYLDRTTGQYWIKDDATTRTWEIAITFCEGLTLGTYADWRVPTQKELLMASIDRIFEVKTPLNITNVGYWTATTVSTSAGASAQEVFPSSATTASVPKTNSANVLCVRP